MHLIGAFAKSHSPVCIISANEGVFMACNPVFIQTFGYTAEQLIGYSPMQVGVWTDHEFRAKAWALLRNENRIIDLHAEIRCGDNSIQRHVINAEYVECEGVVCILFILHPPEDATLPLPGNISDTFYRSLYLAASEGLYRALPTGGFIEANPALAKIFNSSPTRLGAGSVKWKHCPSKPFSCAI